MTILSSQTSPTSEWPSFPWNAKSCKENRSPSEKQEKVRSSTGVTTMNSWERWAHRATTRRNLRLDSSRKERTGHRFPGGEPRKGETTRRGQAGSSQEPQRCHRVWEVCRQGTLDKWEAKADSTRWARRHLQQQETKRVLNKAHQRDVSKTQEPSWKNTRGQTGATANKPWKDAQHR